MIYTLTQKGLRHIDDGGNELAGFLFSIFDDLIVGSSSQPQKPTDPFVREALQRHFIEERERVVYRIGKPLAEYSVNDLLAKIGMEDEELLDWATDVSVRGELIIESQGVRLYIPIIRLDKGSILYHGMFDNYDRLKKLPRPNLSWFSPIQRIALGHVHFYARDIIQSKLPEEDSDLSFFSIRCPHVHAYMTTIPIDLLYITNDMLPFLGEHLGVSWAPNSTADFESGQNACARFLDTLPDESAFFGWFYPQDEMQVMLCKGGERLDYVKELSIRVRPSIWKIMYEQMYDLLVRLGMSNQVARTLVLDHIYYAHLPSTNFNTGGIFFYDVIGDPSRLYAPLDETQAQSDKATSDYMSFYIGMATRLCQYRKCIRPVKTTGL